MINEQEAAKSAFITSDITETTVVGNRTFLKQKNLQAYINYEESHAHYVVDGKRRYWRSFSPDECGQGMAFMRYIIFDLDNVDKLLEAFCQKQTFDLMESKLWLYDALHLLPGDALREAVEVLKTESYEEYCAKLLGMGIENPNHYAVYLHSKEDVADMRDFQQYIIPQVREAYENHVLRPDFGIRNTSAEMSVMQK